MTVKKKSSLLLLLPFGLILINFKIADVMGASLKPIHFIVLLIILSSFFGKMKVKNVFYVLIYLLIPFLAIGNVISISAFISTYLIYVLYLLLVLVGIRHYFYTELDEKKRMLVILFRAFNFSALYGIVQFILANVFGNFSLYNNLGRFQFHPHLDNEIFGIVRATSFYIEPSVLAWVSTTIMALLLYLRQSQVLSPREYRITFLLSLTSIVVALSAAGLIASATILLLYTIFFSKGNFKYLKIIMICTGALLLLFSSQVSQYLRLDEIVRPNTSGYMRVLEPFYAMIEVFQHYPLFGRGMGQIGVFDEALSYNVNIHNSIFGIFVTFGISAALYIIPILVHFIRLIKKDKFVLILFVNLMFVLLTTGSFLSLEIPIIYCIIIVSILYKRSYAT